MSKENQMRDYLARINPVIERLIIDLLVDMPENYVQYSVNWFQEKGSRLAQGEDIPSSSNLKTNIQVGESQQDFDFLPAKIPDNYEHPNLDSEEDDEDEDHDSVEHHIIQQQQKNKGKGMRASVSAEAYGSFNKKGSYVPKVVHKEEEQKKRIEHRLMQAFMFQALDEKEREIVVNAMTEVKFSPGDWIIKQGEDGDNLYVVDQGELDCYKKFSKDAEDTYLKTYMPGEAFGELALLYNAPRAASIKAKTDSILFSLDRECFNNIVKESAIKRRERFEQTLQKVELLDSMDPYERVHLADGIRDIKHKAGEYVIREGEEGKYFYMIEEGQLKATKTENGHEVQVYEYKEGDYFGELALVKNIPRQANVIATTDVKLMYLDHDTFKRLLGPIEGILKRNETRYAKYNPENIVNLTQ
ncbi:CAMP-dependent kinase, regulatory protein (macronuclear) [Tetrahymena thermophila SB210]|uniref:cAMP-dependent protein kinase regulatory subunit n=1 Tax=Tetrahymena thermophila (strain SB210) TaxID=312017 RepID=Q240X5_TETTS|nr:CAMP-dependent kinase, regulatory protein [Tetrahymena thermophila SB210]EAS02289.2 CAMP-dependent kinase, regulatory protein [Tetrahymena thermophila SB210]|eukprot:XP_001022534.2 CAMP-dependent kinase, regulatory protein [Tetrahymena thermophila SB210]